MRGVARFELFILKNGPTKTMHHNIIIADDHPLFRTALRHSVNQVVQAPDVSEAATIGQLQSMLAASPNPDLILLDLNMPGAHGLSALVFLQGQYSNVPVAVVSATDEQSVMLKAKGHGARGFIPKSTPPEALKAAIADILAGKQWWPSHFRAESVPEASDMEARLATLTPQQFRVLGMISEGLLNKQIAYDLAVSEATIKAHVTAIFKKLGVRNRTQAVIAINTLEIEPPQSTNNQNGST